MFRKIKWLALLVLLIGCDQSPDFTKDCIVTKKTIYNAGVAEYVLNPDNGTRGKGWGGVSFRGPESLANVGDTLIFIDNSIRVRK